MPIRRIVNAEPDDVAMSFGTDATVKILYETADANANALIFVAPEGGATDVPVCIFGDASIDNVDLGFFNGITEPTIAVINDAGDAYASLDAGDDAVAGSKGLYFKAAADEDIELVNLSVTGTPRIYWDESEDQFRSTKGWVFDAACDVQGVWVATATWTLPAVTLGGIVSGVSTTNYFDAGAGSAQIVTTTSNQGLRVESSGDPHGPALYLAMTHTTPEVTAYLASLFFEGYDGAGTPVAQNMANMSVRYTNVTDGTEAVRMVWDLWTAGATNEAMILLGNGTLSVDLSGVSGTYANVDLFDEYDDALVLRQGIQQNNRELLADMGILTRKDTGSGYMMNLQPMVRLLAGGIYQSRAMIDGLAERLENMERKLLEVR